MSSLHQYLTNDISDESYTWGDDADEQTAEMLHDAVSDDPDQTIDLDMNERADFYSTLNAIRSAQIAQEIDLAWAQHEAAGDGD